MRKLPRLALDPARASLAQKLLDLLDRAAVHVAGDGVLQAGGRHGEFERVPVLAAAQPPEYQPRGKRISCPHPIHHIQYFIARAVKELLAVVEARRPAVPIGVVAFTQRDRLLTETGKGL